MSLYLSPLEHRINQFQKLIGKGRYYKIMNWNLALLRKCFWKGNGKFIKPTQQEIKNHYEDLCFY